MFSLQVKFELQSLHIPKKMSLVVKYQQPFTEWKSGPVRSLRSLEMNKVEDFVFGCFGTDARSTDHMQPLFKSQELCYRLKDIISLRFSAVVFDTNLRNQVLVARWL